ncbi:MAG: NAD(P)/FAD-dependent oxidoreductase [Nanoarchaeota archaeon]
MAENTLFDTVIVGGGLAGYGAALYAGRFKMKSVILSKDTGGTINWAHVVDNYPGIPNIEGIDLADKIKEHALKFGTGLKLEEVENLKKEGENFRIKTNKAEYLTRTVIIVTGRERKKLGIPGEEELHGNGVHTCAICDAFLYKGKNVAVVGGSDSAAKEALVLSEHAKKVYIIYRREKIRAEPTLYEMVTKTENIEIINNTNVTQAKGEGRLSHVILDNPYNGSNELPLDGLFIDVGYVPLNELARTIGVKENPKGEIVVDKMNRTNVDGVFAAGDVTDIEFKQAITSVAEGAKAAYMAFNHLNTKSS